mmetsp:Transcript_24096/g.56985  ORF Transcript_24096/g.56985 Transcript_24096/m.56985 type:complete len:245 (-) Transcript_24096:18-752(-)
MYDYSFFWFCLRAIASSALFFSISIFSSLRFASAAAASASAVAFAISSSNSSAESCCLSSALSKSISDVGETSSVVASGEVSMPCSQSGISSTLMVSSNRLESIRIRREGIHLSLPIVYVPSTTISNPSSGSIGGGCMKPLERGCAFMLNIPSSSLSRDISRSISSICFRIESARLIRANPTVSAPPVAPGSATDVNDPTNSSSLLPSAYNFCPGWGACVKFSKSSSLNSFSSSSSSSSSDCVS